MYDHGEWLSFLILLMYDQTMTNESIFDLMVSAPNLFFKNYIFLVGRAGMMPKFCKAEHQSRFNFSSGRDTVQVHVFRTPVLFQSSNLHGWNASIQTDSYDLVRFLYASLHLGSGKSVFRVSNLGMQIHDVFI